MSSNTENLVIPPHLMGDTRMLIRTKAFELEPKIGDFLRLKKLNWMVQVAGLHLNPKEDGFVEFGKVAGFGKGAIQALRQLLKDIKMDFGMFDMPSRWLKPIPDFRDKQADENSDQYRQAWREHDDEHDRAFEAEVREAFQIPSQAKIPNYLQELYGIHGSDSDAVQIEEGRLTCGFAVSPEFLAVARADPKFSALLEQEMKDAAAKAFRQAKDVLDYRRMEALGMFHSFKPNPPEGS